LLSIQSESAIIELSSDSTKFKSTSVKSYHQDSNLSFDVDQLNISSSLEFSSSEHINPHLANSIMLITDESTSSFSESIKRDRDRSRKYFASIANVVFNIISINSSLIDSSFITFRQKEIVDLLEKNVFLSVNKRNVSADVRIFSFRFVNEIKHLDTEKAFEKFRLVIQTFNDQNKTLVLTQSSIIQRVNQRLIICLIVSLFQMKLYLRNIIQAYVQSITSLNRDFYVQSLSKLIKLMRIFHDCILKMIKSLYDVSKADNH
jgi:type III secretory pathway component EscS